MSSTRLVIMGAAGRDFHDFNTVFRDDETCEIGRASCRERVYCEV